MLIISCYEGVLGGGKSYHAVGWALRYLAKGGRIYSNIRLVRDKCEAWVRDRYGVELDWGAQYSYLTPSDIASLHEVVRGGLPGQNTLVILDEIHLYHNSRDWANASRGLLNWLTQSRKLFTDIIMITQHRNNVDKQWVRLIERFWHFRDLRNWKIPGLGFKFPFFQCLAVEIDQDGRTVLEKHFERFDKSIFTCYDSAQLFDGAALGFLGAGAGFSHLKRSENLTGSARVFWSSVDWFKKQRWYVKVGCLILVLLAAVGGGWSIVKMTHKTHESFQRDSAVETPSSSHPAEVAPEASSRPPPPSPFVVCDNWMGSSATGVQWAYGEGLVWEDRLPVSWSAGSPVFRRSDGRPYP